MTTDHKDNEYVERVKPPCFVRAVNLLGKLCCGSRLLKWLVPFRLDEAALLKTAQRRSGKDVPTLDEGRLAPKGIEESKEETTMMKYKEPMKVLQAELAKAKLTTMGTLFMHSYFSSILSTRMLVMNYIRQNYLALNKVEIKRPLFVIGLPRCGTTITFNLLASDPSARCVLNWQAQCPTLPEKQAKWQVGLGTAAANYMVPTLKTVHEFGIDEPEECVIFMGPTLINYFFVLLTQLPGYFDYMYASSTREQMPGVYRYHKYILQILQTRYPAKDKVGNDKHWVLKTPVHLAFIDFLLEMYPDARIVWNHRELTSAISSTASLIKHFQMLTQDKIDRKEIGHWTMKGAQLWLNRAVEIRKKHEKNFYDLDFDELIDDPVAAMKRIYTRFDMKWNDDVENAMKNTYKNMPRNKHGAHKYSMEMFGLTQEKMQEACAPYYEFLKTVKQNRVSASVGSSSSSSVDSSDSHKSKKKSKQS